MQAWHAFRNNYVTYARNPAASAAQLGERRGPPVRRR
jgi:hypothetical protein